MALHASHRHTVWKKVRGRVRRPDYYPAWLLTCRRGRFSRVRSGVQRSAARSPSHAFIGPKKGSSETGWCLAARTSHGARYGADRASSRIHTLPHFRSPLAHPQSPSFFRGHPHLTLSSNRGWFSSFALSILRFDPSLSLTCLSALVRLSALTALTQAQVLVKARGTSTHSLFCRTIRSESPILLTIGVPSYQFFSLPRVLTLTSATCLSSLARPASGW